MPVLTARTLITAIGSVAYPAITVSADGFIEDVSSDPSIASDRILTPTFLDIHTHGAAGEDVLSRDAGWDLPHSALPGRPGREPLSAHDGDGAARRDPALA